MNQKNKYSLEQRVRFKIEGLLARLLNRVSYSEGMCNLLRWLSSNTINIDRVFDVGASNGSWSKLCFQYYPQAKYTLIEPQKIHRSSLEVFKKSNASKKIDLKFVAVAGEVGTTSFDVTDPFGGALITSGFEQAGCIDIVEGETLDYIASNSESFSSALIKLDTHGFEKIILDNAKECLLNTSALIVEAYNYRLNDDALLFWELCEYMNKRGFSVVNLVDVMRRPKDSTLWQMDILFIKSDWDGFQDNLFK